MIISNICLQSTDNLDEDVVKAVTYPNTLEKYRLLNYDFVRDVINIIERSGRISLVSIFLNQKDTSQGPK